MTPATIQALRRLLFFSVEEAATLIGGVSQRSWQFWERGDRTIPEDVIEHIRSLCAWRAQALTTAENQIAALQARHGPAASVALIWYQSLDDWTTLPGREPALWRPQQSVCAAVLAEFPDRLRLVRFDPPAYSAWLAERQDSETMRGQWAAAVDSAC